MPGAVIGPEVILYRCIGMRDGYFPEFSVAPVLGGPDQHFEVHQVINDHRAIEVVVLIP
ncbi:hypothetical protein D9M69_660870 [compost metagenome]